MIIIPAIDLKGGRCVRLRQGRADDVTEYGDNPAKMAKRWQDEGARALHVVDLDGAFQGAPAHTDVIADIVGAINIPVEVGGGLRECAHVEALISAGVSRVIIGTRAIEKTDFIAELVDKFGSERIAVGIDARDGFVQTKGWTETTRVSAVTLAKRVAKLGVGTIIYTDTATDGMLGGTNVGAVAKICEAVDCEVVASGGVTAADDIVALKSIGAENLAGAIVGKALYDGKTTLLALQIAADA